MEKMKFGKNEIMPVARNLSDMKKVLFDREWLKTAENFEVYYMFRNLFLRDGHKKIMEKFGIQYDITVIPPAMLGSEFTKTKGHYHPAIDGTNLTYPEIYEVLEGEAHYLLQREEGGVLKDVVVVRALPGDKVVIPPGYGHITINASKKTLKMANFVCSRFSSDYDSLERRRGGAYFMLINGIIVPNKNYSNVLPLRFMIPRDLGRFGIKRNHELYSLLGTPKVLRFLTHPEKNPEIFLL